MKKTAFVLFLAAIMVFTFAATAMAGTSSGTITWDSTAPNDSPATPHKGYALTTEKCLVCHAVHKATADGEVLLGAIVADACDYCHVSATGVSSVRVYNNDPANHQSDTVYNHSNKCSACHAVHGANTVDQTALSQKILRADIGVQSGVPAVDWDLDSGSHDGALSAYCTQCHPYFVDTYALSNTDGDVQNSLNLGGGPYNSHIMTGDYADYVPGSGATHVGTPDTTDPNVAVAYAPSTYCTSCHDGGADTVADNFPHLTSGARFMMSSSYVNDTAVAAQSATQDGVCLKCHRGTNDLTGVGIDF